MTSAALRQYWGKQVSILPPLNLTAVQQESYRSFLAEGIEEGLAGISPVKDFTGKAWQLELGEHELGEPKCTPAFAKEKGVTYEAPLRAKARLTNLATSEVVEQEVFLGDIPQITEVGTFIINGVERAVVNQLVRSPGVFYSGNVDPSTGRMLYQAELRPLRGSWLEFMVGKNDVISVKVDRSRKLPVTTLLRAIGIGSDEELAITFADVDTDKQRQYIAATSAKDATKSRQEAIIDVYQRLRPGEPAVLENAESLLREMFFDERRYQLGKVGRYKLNRRLGLSIPNVPEKQVLQVEDIVAVVKYLIQLQNGKGRVDDIDHLSNRRIRRVGELGMETAVRTGFFPF